jgi:inhibitor of cysteine peptidase
MEATNEPAPGPTATMGGGKTEAGKAMVDSVEVQIRESLPVQVSVNVKGNLPDACTQINVINTLRDGNTFNVDISTTRPVEVLCAQVLTPFEENVSLDVKGLNKGTYTVNVNGVTATFDLP